MGRTVDLYDMSDHTVHIKSAIRIDEPLFTATPAQVSFTEYEAYATYSVQISLRNKDIVSQHIAPRHSLFGTLLHGIASPHTSQPQPPS
jgi:hypothetical protein